MAVVGYISLFLLGLVLGTLGGGGSILSVPILVYLFRMDAVTATAYSLFIVGVASLVGSFMKHQTRMVSFHTALLFGGPSLCAIFCVRRWIIPSLPEVIFQTESLQLTKRALILGTFATVMILAALLVLTQNNTPSPEGKQYPDLILAFIGLLTGSLCGFVGAGGGFLIIPALVYGARLDFKIAVGTTLLIITFNSLIGFLGDIMNYPVDWLFLLSLSTLAIGGIVVGVQTTLHLPAPVLRRAFGGLVLAIGIWIFTNEIFGLSL